jgi:hypothetical protein
VVSPLGQRNVTAILSSKDEVGPRRTHEMVAQRNLLACSVLRIESAGAAFQAVFFPDAERPEEQALLLAVG